MLMVSVQLIISYNLIFPHLSTGPARNSLQTQYYELKNTPHCRCRRDWSLTYKMTNSQCAGLELLSGHFSVSRYFLPARGTLTPRNWSKT